MTFKHIVDGGDGCFDAHRQSQRFVGINGIEPVAYITDVIAKIADNWPASRWDELMTWNWQPDQNISQAA